MDHTLRSMIRAAEAGGRVIRKYFGKQISRTVKSHHSDYRTRADVESEHSIVRVLRRSCPQHAIHSEEGTTADGTSGWRFIIDPLDGTNNFVLGVPYVGVSVALFDGQHMQYGVVCDAMQRRTFYARRQRGAFRDGRRIRVSRIRSLQRSTIGFTQDYGPPAGPALGLFQGLLRRGAKRVTNYWSPALDLCSIADGRAEALVVLGNQVYDFAAGALIVREAGGVITDLKGRAVTHDDNRWFVAANNRTVQRQLVPLLK